MNSHIDNIISQLNALKSLSTNINIPKELFKKWEESYTVSELQNNTTLEELRLLCNYFDLKETGQKKTLASRLWEHWESLESDSDSESESGSEFEESGSDESEYED